ncbi:hypothetical protein ATANTOWER_024387 [Ataeniobius toweri]|uniref:Uncharacterized protein n=1 Tax=Ataeniobius toweri TaxID=208326 RepID=A0ABU7AV05_9TELE|nr:hypothetical protein [Ataeniobius toweri]
MMHGCVVRLVDRPVNRALIWTSLSSICGDNGADRGADGCRNRPPRAPSRSSRHPLSRAPPETTEARGVELQEREGVERDLEEEREEEREGGEAAEATAN